MSSSTIPPIVSLFGTCRLDRIQNHTNLNNLINYTHCTKEIIQQIKFIKGDLKLPSPYDILCFRTGILNRSPIQYESRFTELFENTDVFIVEICSRKKYICDGFYLHHLPFDKYHKHVYHDRATPYVLENMKIEKQSDQEIEDDILEIQKLLYPKKMIIVSHYDSKIDGVSIPERTSLIHLLYHICDKHDIPFVDPARMLSMYTQEELMDQDLGHYAPFGIEKFSERINAYISDICRSNTIVG